MNIISNFLSSAVPRAESDLSALFRCSRISCTISLRSCLSGCKPPLRQAQQSPVARLSACALVQSVTFGAADWQAAGTRATANNQRHSRHTDADREINENCPIRLVSRSSFRLAKPHNTHTLSLSSLCRFGHVSFQCCLFNSPYHLVDIVASPYLPTIIHPGSSSPFLCSLSYCSLSFCSLSYCSLSYCFLQSRDAAFLAFLSFPFPPPPFR